MSANNSQVVSGQDASSKKAGNQTKPSKHDKEPVERISKRRDETIS